MKKHFYFAMLFLLFLTVSCVSEKIETPEDRASYNPETVWEYNGDNTTLNKVIQELKNSPNREKLERRLLKNDVLWENAKPILIDNKKRILVPFLSINKDNVIGVLSLVKDAEGKTTFDMVVRKDLMTKSATLPFWKRGVWAGYFMALDKDILGIKNGSPGLVEKPVVGKAKAKSKNTQAMRTVCGDIPVLEICITYSQCESNDGGETWENCVELYTDCYYEYDWRCWDVPDECPAGYEMDENGNCVLVNQTCPAGYEKDVNGNCVPIDDSVIFNGMTFNTFDDFLSYINTESYEMGVTGSSSPISKTGSNNAKIAQNTFTTYFKIKASYIDYMNIDVVQILHRPLINQAYSITSITSGLSGITWETEWEQTSYSYQTDNLVSIIDLNGTFIYSFIHRGIGEIFRRKVLYKMIIEKYSGNPVAITRTIK